MNRTYFRERGVYIMKRENKKMLRERYEDAIRKRTERLKELSLEDLRDIYTMYEVKLEKDK